MNPVYVAGCDNSQCSYCGPSGECKTPQGGILLDRTGQCCIAIIYAQTTPDVREESADNRSTVELSDGLTVRELKQIVNRWPETGSNGEMCEIWIETGSGVINPIMTFKQGAEGMFYAKNKGVSIFHD